MFCPSCGVENPDGGGFCSGCGNSLSGSSGRGGRAQPPQQKKGGFGKAVMGVAGCLGLCLVLSVIAAIADPNRSAPSRASTGGDRVGGGGGADTSEPAEPSPPKAIEVSPAALVRQYDENEIKADNDYEGKVLRVTGPVSDIGKDLMGSIFVTLDGGHPVREVQVLFDDSHADKIANLSKGDRITIRGTCEGLMMNVQIHDAVLE